MWDNTSLSYSSLVSRLSSDCFIETLCTTLGLKVFFIHPVPLVRGILKTQMGVFVDHMSTQFSFFGFHSPKEKNPKKLLCNLLNRLCAKMFWLLHHFDRSVKIVQTKAFFFYRKTVLFLVFLCTEWSENMLRRLEELKKHCGSFLYVFSCACLKCSKEGLTTVWSLLSARPGPVSDRLSCAITRITRTPVGWSKIVVCLAVWLHADAAKRPGKPSSDPQGVHTGWRDKTHEEERGTKTVFI